MAIYDINGSQIFGSVEIDPTFSVDGSAADAKLTGDYLQKLDAFVEPVADDIPTLYFSGNTLPETKEEGKILFNVTYSSKTLTFSEYCTLKVQGDGSLKYPKKNFNIQFYKDSAKSKKSKHNFKGWGNQSKFTLKANWSDITHSRNIVNARIWYDVVKTRSNYASLPADMIASPHLATIDGFVVRVFVNGIYYGRYTFNIPKDPWMYNMDDELENNVVLYGEGKAGTESTAFEAEAVIDGTDWTDEIHEDAVPQSVIDNFNTFIRFVINSTNTQFYSNLSQYVDVESLIDVYLFAYTDCGVDNIGKNEIFMSYGGSRYICSVYDLDTTWGLRWDGVLAFETDTNYYMSRSNLHRRLAANFAAELRSRYTELRNSALSDASILNHFEKFMFNQPPYLIAEDYAETTADGDFVDIPSKETNNIHQLRTFIKARLAYVDSQILT